MAKVASLVMAGRTLGDLATEGMLPDVERYRHLAHTAVKAPVLPFGRFPGQDTLLGPEMKSTGEVMGVARTLGPALAKALMSTGAGLPTRGTALISAANRDKRGVVHHAKRLHELGFRLMATGGTAAVRGSGPNRAPGPASRAPGSAAAPGGRWRRCEPA